VSKGLIPGHSKHSPGNFISKIKTLKHEEIILPFRILGRFSIVLPGTINGPADY
jgi:hypothetical protein